MPPVSTVDIDAMRRQLEGDARVYPQKGDQGSLLVIHNAIPTMLSGAEDPGVVLVRTLDSLDDRSRQV